MINLREASIAAQDVRCALDLLPHPEGGHYREIWRDLPAEGGRGAATSILFLLAEGERSHWHRVDAAEIWIWQAGAPLSLDLAGQSLRLGPDFGASEILQAVVPKGAWQAAQSLGAWSLVCCVVAPAFEFSGFELAPADFKPPGA
jgi:predicted cupin superfamily sugar epimerase